MAKGGKKNDKDASVVSLGNLPDDGSENTSSVRMVEPGREHLTELHSASVVSQPSVDAPISDVAHHEIPVLMNLILERYEGEKCGKLFHGEGVAYFQGGHVYKGMLSKGLMHGRGLYTWADGLKYEGEFASNVPMGYGTYTWQGGSCYEGEICNGIRHGIGTYKCAKTSAIYRGQWHNGKRHGKGIVHFNKDTTSWYEGDWVNNYREGYGICWYVTKSICTDFKAMCNYPSGNIYDGEWRNNVRHGKGKMRWLHLGQQYNGQWENGIQHGQGTYTWFLRRVPGSQYPLRNEYSGEFVQGLRQGQGKFLYASGAMYTGEWKSDQKHGKGKFIFKNGRIFEGEFVEDRMAEFPALTIHGSKTPDLSDIKTHSPPPEDVSGDSLKNCTESEGNSSLLGPDLVLNIDSVLNCLPEAHRDHELKQVEFAVLRHIAQLRGIYNFYSRLGHGQSPDNTFLLTRLQFWRFLKDCNVHQHGLTLAQIDHMISDDVPPEDVHSPFSTIFLRKCISSIVILAYNIYHNEINSPSNTLMECFSKLMKQNIIPNAKKVKGPLFCHPIHALIGMSYFQRSWEIYQHFCLANIHKFPEKTMTIRHFLWMLKDLCLFDSELTIGSVLEILSAENPAIYNTSHSNLDLEMTFLEFFEALLGCAEIKSMQEVKSSMKSLSEEAVGMPMGDERRDSSLLTREPSPQSEPVKSFNTKPSLNIESTESLEIVRSKEILQSLTPTKMEQKSSINFKAETGDSMAHVSATSSAEMGMGSDIMDRTSDTQAADQLPSTSTETLEEAEPETELETWINRAHLFFTNTFFPEYEYSLQLKEEIQEQRLRQTAKNRMDLARAKEEARRRKQREAEEEERHSEEDEEDETGRGEGLDEPSTSSPALMTPVVSTVSLAPQKHPPTSATKKKRK